MSNVIQQAMIFATAAHAAVGQKRKYSGDDYIVHPARVASIVTEANGTDEMIAAAWLHDTVEDTDVSSDVILDIFGPAIHQLVVELTDLSKPEDGNRAIRKGIDADRLALASRDAQIVKLADLIDNGDDIAKNDPSFAKVFLKEKAHLIKVMDKAHTHPLFKVANGVVNGGK